MSSAETETNMAATDAADMEVQLEEEEEEVKEEEEEDGDEEEEEEDENEKSPVAFLLQLEKSISSQVKTAEWNPEKDLLAMVTDDSKILLYRFNWQRLWTVSPGKCVTSLCWRPDGKVIAAGFEDGYIALYDVEHGKLLRNSKDHKASVICLCWEEDAQELMDQDESNVPFIYEDRTLRFFPPPPRIPRMPGLSVADAGPMDNLDNSFLELSYSSNRRFTILCSGDKNGSICFSVFGIFSIGKINIQSSPIFTQFHGKKVSYYLICATLHKVAFSKNLCDLTILTFGDLDEVDNDLNCPGGDEKNDEQKETCRYEGSKDGLHCLLFDTSIFHKRKNELFQVVQQASSIEYLIEVARGSLSVMRKQWCDAMTTFHQSFDPLYSLIDQHGLMSDPQVEFFGFLFGARTSPPLQQFLLQNLGDSGVKRVAKVICNAGKDIQSVVREHLQPSAEIIAFRIGELIGLSKWRTRYQGIGMDRKCVDLAVEKAGMFLVQVERFTRVLATILYEFQNFFNWLSNSIKHLMSESTAADYHIFNRELVILFLQFHFDHDIVKQLLEFSITSIDVDYHTILRLDDLGDLGGFSDNGFLEKSLAKQFEELETSFKDAFSIMYTTISKKITSEYFMPLHPCSSRLPISSSISYDTNIMVDATKAQQEFEDYISFKIPNDSLGMANNIVIMRRLKPHSNGETPESSLQAVILSMPDGFECIDLSLYKERQIVLLLNETATGQMEIPRHSLIVLLETNVISFTPSTSIGFWMLSELKDSIVELISITRNKARFIKHRLTKPLAVGVKRGVACVFSTRKRALVYILDENEEIQEKDNCD